MEKSNGLFVLKDSFFSLQVFPDFQRGWVFIFTMAVEQLRTNRENEDDRNRRVVAYTTWFSNFRSSKNLELIKSAARGVSWEGENTS